ncbi:S8 family serine peptidase [Phycicoccus sp. CSK15P-2]|uniref:S8 family serine peptidase n=1 Tax=Phycicoccus sp. CSK15P-2 TaxID=2807627 RepID=UPI001951F05F|nr:S8 family serine peptidase [Phycicoccus sp. CSK15P-2]MBM6402998.1 S8 family serine peptidase [Phycicoccus sp. CSK15P-2]
MRRSRMVALTGVAALAMATAGAATTAQARESGVSSESSARTSYAVLAEKGADVGELASRLEKSGAKVVSVNEAIGMVTVSSEKSGFLASARSVEGVDVAAREGVVGHAPRDAEPDRTVVERLRGRGPASGHGEKGRKGTKAESDPLDSYLWGMDMIGAPAAHKVERGNKKVLVGVMDTGVDASHPDIAPNFDRKRSRNFTTDMEDVDGPCEEADCVDPADVDQNGHGTHVAGTIAGALNGIGVSGVAPDVGIVNVRAGQDSGYFFLTPTVDALTYSGDVGIDVVNMSFYVDPWAYNCIGGAPEDSPEEAAEQAVIIEAMNRALEYAHAKGVTLVAALGNGHDDLANPRNDTSSPDYPGGTEHERTIDGQTCFDLPTEGPHVIGVSAVGPTKRKSYFSNYTTDLKSGEIEVSAPGGDYRDNYGTDEYATPGNLILSAAPLGVLQEAGDVDENGDITEQGEGWVMKDCRTVRTRWHREGREECGYYQYLQGTSMAAPHAAGVAALVVSAHGRSQGRSGFGLAPDRTASYLMRTATDTPCPETNPYVYPDRTDEYTAECVGNKRFNGFYGDGIVNALRAVR